MTYTNPPLFKRRAVGFFSLLLFVPQTWGSAFQAGFAYTAGQQYTNRPFLERVGCVFPFVTAKLHRLGVLHSEQGSHIPQGNDIQTVLFKERGGWGFRSSPAKLP